MPIANGPFGEAPRNVAADEEVNPYASPAAVPPLPSATPAPTRDVRPSAWRYGWGSFFFGLCSIYPPFGIVALILGFMAISSGRQATAQWPATDEIATLRRSEARTGITLGIVGICIVLAYVALFFVLVLA